MNEQPDDQRESERKNYSTSLTSVADSGVLGFYDRVIQSSKNLAFYRIPLVEPSSKAFYYTLKLFLLIGIISGTMFAYSQWTVSQQLLQEISRKIPKIQFHNGKLDLDVDVPHRLTLMNDYEVVIDPEGSQNRLELPENVKVVVVNGAIFVRNGASEFSSWSTRTHEDPDKAETILINSSYIQSWAPYINAGVAFVTFLATILAVALRNYFRIVILVPTGNILFPGEGIQLNWSSHFNLACYAITPIVLLETVLLVLNLTPPYADYLFLGLTLLWFYVILNSISTDLDESQPNPVTVEENTNKDKL